LVISNNNTRRRITVAVGWHGCGRWNRIRR